jgi:hypothetical protein
MSLSIRLGMISAGWLCLLGCGDDEDCRVPLVSCDRSSCQVVEGTPLEGVDGPSEARAAGCLPKGTLAADIVTGARASDGACWMFPSDGIPFGFEPAPECLPD